MALLAELETSGHPQNYYIILRELIEIKDQIKDVRSRLNAIEGHTDKMTSHVYFVENLYDKVKKPFMMLMDKINQYGGNIEIIDETDNTHIRDKIE